MSGFGDFSIPLGRGRSVNCVRVMRVECAHCDEPVERGSCIALGFPYLALVHEHCLPYFDFSRDWPHPRPAFSYTQHAQRTAAIGWDE